MAHEPVAARDALRMIAAGPVALLTTMYRQQPNVMTVGWLMPISLDPVLIGIAVQPARLTHTFLTRSEQAGLSIPVIDQLPAVHGCGMVSGRDLDKFERFGLTPGDPEQIDAPWVVDSVAHLECGLRQRYSIGDHDLFVCEVIGAWADPAAFSAGWLAEGEGGIVHHLGGDVYASMSRSYRAGEAPPAQE